MVVPVVRVVQRDRDDRAPVSLRRRHQTPTGGSCEAGLDADRAVIHRQQAVVVDEGAPGGGAGFRGNHVAEHRVAQSGGGDFRKLPRGRVVVFRRQAARVLEMRVGKAEFCGFRVHLFDKRRHAAALARDSRRRVVARGEQQPVKRLAQGEPLALLQVHGRAFRHVLALDREHSVEVALAERHERGHDFGRGRHGQTAVRIRGEKRFSRVRVHRHRRRRAERRSTRHERRTDAHRYPQPFHTPHSLTHNTTYSTFAMK